jgi:hypothetical protein
MQHVLFAKFSAQLLVHQPAAQRAQDFFFQKVRPHVDPVFARAFVASSGTPEMSDRNLEYPSLTGLITPPL